MLESAEPLARAYDLAMLDLDGVVYIGGEAVPGVGQHLARATELGMALAYVTNNASRPPEDVAAHLRRLGLPAEPGDVVTSAQAAARLVSARTGPGAVVFVIGGTGLEQALEELGLVPTQDPNAGAVAVVSGYSPDLRWQTVIEGSVLIRSGVPWVASNTDLTIPTKRGPGPGAGVLVRAISGYAEVEPVVAGKPEPPLFHETCERCGGRRPLVVGDRLDTDIEGAARAGFDSLLVMTGVTGLPELVAATPERRPSFVAADLGALGRPQTAPRRDGERWRPGSASATEPAPGPPTVAAAVEEGRLVVTGSAEDADAWWQVVAAAAWDALDTTGRPVDIRGVVAPEPSMPPGPG